MVPFDRPYTTFYRLANNLLFIIIILFYFIIAIIVYALTVAVVHCY